MSPLSDPSRTNPPTQRNDREKMLARIKEALRAETSPHVKSVAVPDASSTPGEIAGCLPPAPSDREGMRNQFAERSATLRTEFECVSSAADLSARVQALAAEHEWRAVGWHQHDIVSPLVQELRLDAICTSDEYDVAALERCDVAITGCDALIAQTGSVLVTSTSTGGRALSVLPPHHVVIATADQLVPDLPAAYSLLTERYVERLPSMVSLITGPSRTGDIERILVLGAHGPKRLSVLLIEDPA